MCFVNLYFQPYPWIGILSARPAPPILPPCGWSARQTNLPMCSYIIDFPMIRQGGVSQGAPLPIFSGIFLRISPRHPFPRFLVAHTSWFHGADRNSKQNIFLFSILLDWYALFPYCPKKIREFCWGFSIFFKFCPVFTSRIFNIFNFISIIITYIVIW